jgi:SAM-dependent methyltransferase
LNRDHGELEVATGAGSWVGWCCPYCAAPLEERPHGLWCAAEERWLATQDGVHRLLPDDRRREVQPVLEMLQRVRRDERPEAQAERARRSAIALRQALPLLRERLGPGHWRVLQVGCSAAAPALRLLELGHHVAAIDVDLDPEHGLGALAPPSTHPAGLPRAEAEIDSLPVEPGRFDLVLAADVLHHTARITRALVELRRVTRRRGVMAVLDSPVYRSRAEGEAMVAARMEQQQKRYGWVLPREHQPGHLVLGELAEVFRATGWRLEVHGWPGPLRERLLDTWSLLRHGRRHPRHPILIGRRDG